MWLKTSYFVIAVFVSVALPLIAQTASTNHIPRRLSLDEALRLAAGTSETIAIARAGVATAAGQRRASRAERFPQVNSFFPTRER